MSKILIYHLYPFAWSGLEAMKDFLPVLSRLTVNYVWLSPIYPSGGFDAGYDPTDYCSVDSRFGTMADFDDFVAEAQKYGIGVLMDLVINHTSIYHPWFQQSRQGIEPYADYYIWTKENLRWRSLFDAESVFSWDVERGRYYAHLFHPHQAELNWEDPVLIYEFNQIIDFWVRHGVAGFRLDVPMYIGKKLRPAYLLPKFCGRAASFFLHYRQPRALNVLHKLFDERDLFTLGETGFPFVKWHLEYAGEHGPLTAAYNVCVMDSYEKFLGVIPTKRPSLARFKRAQVHWSKVPGYVAVSENHDTTRGPSRYGVSPMSLMMDLFNPAVQMVCLHQGQELGLENPPLSNDILGHQDVLTIQRYRKLVGRGVSSAEAMAKLKPLSRDNTRQPLDLEQYRQQMADSDSMFSFTLNVIKHWRET